MVFPWLVLATVTSFHSVLSQSPPVLERETSSSATRCADGNYCPSSHPVCCPAFSGQKGFCAFAGHKCCGPWVCDISQRCCLDPISNQASCCNAGESCHILKNPWESLRAGENLRAAICRPDSCSRFLDPSLCLAADEECSWCCAENQCWSRKILDAGRSCGEILTLPGTKCDDPCSAQLTCDRCREAVDGNGRPCAWCCASHRCAAMNETIKGCGSSALDLEITADANHACILCENRPGTQSSLVSQLTVALLVILVAFSFAGLAVLLFGFVRFASWYRWHRRHQVDNWVEDDTTPSLFNFDHSDRNTAVTFNANGESSRLQTASDAALQPLGGGRWRCAKCNLGSSDQCNVATTTTPATGPSEREDGNPDSAASLLDQKNFDSHRTHVSKASATGLLFRGALLLPCEDHVCYSCLRFHQDLEDLNEEVEKLLSHLKKKCPKCSKPVERAILRHRLLHN